MIEFFFTAQSVEALGWTLLHSLWQGAAFALLLVVILISLRSYSSLSRYVVSVGLLTAFFLTLTTTFLLQLKEANKIETLSQIGPLGEGDMYVSNRSPEIALEVNSAIPSADFSSKVLSSTMESSWFISFKNYYNQHLPLLVTVWFLGILFLQLRLLGQLAYIQRLKHYGVRLFPLPLSSKIAELETKLQIRKKVSYLTSIRVESPMVIGWLKPVVLLPQQLFDSLSETEIYAILAHELAHVRREDFIVNLMQTFLCNVFFFHPGIWWMSNRIDDEREHCCDDLAVAATGPAVNYAKTLITVSEHRLKMQKTPALVMALSGKRNRRERGGFSERIRRLFMLNNGKGTFREGFASAFILVSALFLGVAATESTVSDIDNVDQTISEDAEIETKIETSNAIELEMKIENNPISNITNEINISELPVAPPAAPVMPIASTSQDITRVDALVMACREGDFEFVKTLVKLGIDVNSIGSKGTTPLMMATSHNEVEIVVYLLEQNADVNQTYNSWTALHEAADEGSLASMRLLLKAGANVNFHQSSGSPTAISMAASEGHIDCLKLLIEHGAEINGIGESAPPLHFAAEEGKNDVIDYLISQNVNIDKKDENGRTALMYAASEGQRRSVRKLVDAGADISIVDSNGANAVYYAEREDQHIISSYLKGQDEYTTDYNHEEGQGLYDNQNYNNDVNPSPMHQATYDGHIEKVQRMVEQGADVNTSDNIGRTPLHIASAQGYDLDMRVLMDLGADINAQDYQGRTPLMHAAADGRGNAVALLVSKLADVNIKDVDGMEAYDWARSGDNSDLANFLKLITKSEMRAEREVNRSVRRVNRAEREERNAQKAVNKNQKQFQKAIEKKETFHVSPAGSHLRQFDIEHNTPEFFEIVRHGSLEACSNILKNGQSVNTSDDTGQTVLMVAARTNRLDVAKLLIEQGADVNSSSASGLTALHYATLENHEEMARLLLTNNAKIEATMHYSSTDGNDSNEALVWEYMGATPLMIAVESQNLEVMAILIEAGANKNHTLIRNQYKLHKDRETYLSGSEVMGIESDFLQDGELQESDHSWTPYKHAILIDDVELLSLLAKKK